MILHRWIRLAAVGLGTAVLAIAFVAVTASATGLMAASPSPKPTPPVSYCDAYINHLAADLGKTPDQLKSASAQAAGQTIDDAVSKGDMTAAQADAARKKLSGGAVCPPNLSGIGAETKPEVDFGAATTNAEATALGISRDELIADLKQKDMSLHQIADSKGLSQDQYKAAYVAALKAELDADVQKGTLPQKQEDQILAKVQSEPVPFWDKPAPRPKATPTGG